MATRRPVTLSPILCFLSDINTAMTAPLQHDDPESEHTLADDPAIVRLQHNEIRKHDTEAQAERQRLPPRSGDFLGERASKTDGDKQQEHVDGGLGIDAVAVNSSHHGVLWSNASIPGTWTRGNRSRLGALHSSAASIVVAKAQATEVEGVWMPQASTILAPMRLNFLPIAADAPGSRISHSLRLTWTDAL